MIGIISAVTSNGIIGVDSKLPFNYPEDLKHFKKTTLSSTIIMGRNTFNSIGRPLPKRTNIVITSKPLDVEGIWICNSIQKSLQIAEMKKEDAWFIGGASIYEEAMNYANKIVLTITPDIELRTPNIKFPFINPLKFKIISVESMEYSKLQVVTYEKYT